MFRRFLKNIDGATAFEYAMIAGLVSVAIVAGVTAVGSDTAAIYTTVDEQITGTTN